MAEKPDEVASVSQCTALANFLKEFQALDLDSNDLIQRKHFKDESEQKEYDHFIKEENSKMLWPFYNHLVEKWEIFVKELLKETVEVVFGKLALKLVQCDGTDLNPHLQSIVYCSLLHHSSNKVIHQQGAAIMSSYLLPHPELLKDIIDSYKKHLLTKCEEVVCVFEGANGIDETFKIIFNVNTFFLSNSVLPLQHTYHYWNKKNKRVPLLINSVDNLSALLHFYYGVHCISSGKNSEYFSEMNCEPFRLPIKSKFQECFGEIPGDFLHYFFRNVSEHKKEAYIYYKGYLCAREFFNVLTHALYDAVSKFIKEHFDIDF